MSVLSRVIVFITGASSGIGAATAKRFAQAGARLILAARRTERLQTLAQTLQQQFQSDCHLLTLDVRDTAQVTQAIASLPAQWRDIGILVNNAGLARGMKKIYEGDLAEWEEMLDTNIKGLLTVTHAILPHMVENNHGHIINMGSIAGHYAYPDGNVYCATKYAVRALSEAMRADLLGKKIRVTLISPGLVETEFSMVRFQGDTERAKAVYRDIEALQSEDIADAIVYAASTPPHVNISEMVIMPTAQVNPYLVHRETSG